MVELTPGGVRRRRWDSKDPAALPHIVSSLPDSFPSSDRLPMVFPWFPLTPWIIFHICSLLKIGADLINAAFAAGNN